LFLPEEIIKQQRRQNMKAIFIFFLSSFLSASVFAGTIRISFNGNKNYQAVVDGRTYNTNSYSTNSGNEISLTNLQTGQHSIQISKLNNRNSWKQVYSATYDLTANAEIYITVNANGNVTSEYSNNNEAYDDMSDNSSNSAYATAMSESDYNTLYQSINSKWAQGAKLTAARNAFNNNSYYFTTDQVSRIIRLVTNEANRLELAKLAYDNVVDPTNYRDLYSIFGKQASITQLDKYIRATENNTNSSNNANIVTHAPMTDVSFNNIYNNIRRQWLPGAKLTTARDVFNSSANYFTTAQAKQIIGLLSSEENRLELAKLAFDNISDPANFRQLYDLLSTQSSRDELDTYIRDNYNYSF
jgi:hypothetical protein